jgi:hypothetical protein
MSEQDIKDVLEKAYRSAEGKPPPFAATFAVAEDRYLTSRRRLRVAGGMVAAAAVVAVAVGLWSGQQASVEDEFMIADALMNSTTWTAPSDVLMPDHQFDIYRDIPVLDRSTISEEGTLL